MRAPPAQAGAYDLRLGPETSVPSPVYARRMAGVLRAWRGAAGHRRLAPLLLALSVVALPAAPADVPARERIDAGLAALARSPAGRGLLAATVGAGTRVVVAPGLFLHYDDASDEVRAGEDSLAGSPAWQAAVILAHELEHARQRRLGLAGKGARGARELAAFLVQCRVWVELGGTVLEADWRDNGMNARDMWAWLGRPWSAIAALAMREHLELEPAPAAVEGYWRVTLREDAAWRAERSGRFPIGRGALEAALFVLEQAAGFLSPPPPGGASPWLPDVLESAGSLARGGWLALPEPSPLDAAILSALPFRVRLVRSAFGWRLYREAAGGLAP